MISTALSIPEGDVKRLLSAASPDAALLYIYIHSGNAPDNAAADLQLSQSRLSLASAALRQLGLWVEDKVCTIAPGERPNYSEKDVLSALDTDRDFKILYQEIQRMLGKHLNTEELKILLGFQRYLGLGPDVITVLVSFCRERARVRGSLRAPSLRTIEKEAYAWAEQGIDTMEEAAAYIQSYNVRTGRLQKLMELLQIRGRSLSVTEDRYAQAWLEMGFEDGAIAAAYDRTCTNTGGMNWAYMNKILQRWHTQGLHTVEAIASGDRTNNAGAMGELGEAELEAARRAMQRRP